MILLSARALVRQFDFEPVLDHVSFEVRPGEKIGLVGPNGAGKTTLMKILAELDEADQGILERHPSARVGLLEQEPKFSPERTLIEEAKSGLAPLYGLQAEAEEVAAAIAAESDESARTKLQRRYDAIQLELQRLSAYNIDHRVEEVLHGLGFTPDQYHRELNTFSGGQQNRVLLARLLLSAPDVMLLDEPTNHLDIGATEWLEQYLADSPQAMILVSHDRYFLDKVTNRILEVYAGRVADYPGNFSAYWRQKDERNVVLQRTYEKQQEFIAKTVDFIKKNNYGQKSAQAQDRQKKLERVERVERPTEIPTPLMGFGEPRRAGDWVIEASHVTKGYDEPLFRDVTLRIQRGDRLGIFGPNGAGKTTLLRVLLGELEPDEGTVRHGANVDLAYYDQQQTGIDPQLSCIEAARPPKRPDITPGRVRDQLARFGLRGEIVMQPVGTLSGGEKSKVALARLAGLNANVLVLDEPTNHLDLWSRDALEKSLGEFDGTLVFISHDRYFLNRVATNVLAFEADRWRLFEGNYEAYLDSMRRLKEGQQSVQAEKAPQETKRPEKSDAPKRKRKFPYRKVPDLEVDIAAAEARLAELQGELSKPEVFRDGQRAKEVRVEYDETEKKLAQLMEHWEEAVELNG